MNSWPECVCLMRVSVWGIPFVVAEHSRGAVCGMLLFTVLAPLRISIPKLKEYIQKSHILSIFQSVHILKYQ